VLTFTRLLISYVVRVRKKVRNWAGHFWKDDEISSL